MLDGAQRLFGGSACLPAGGVTLESAEPSFQHVSSRPIDVDEVCPSVFGVQQRRHGQRSVEIVAGIQLLLNDKRAILLSGRLVDDAVFLVPPEFRPMGMTISERFPGAEREVVEQEGVRQMVAFRCTLENGCRTEARP